MVLKTFEEYRKEIKRVEAALETTESEHLKNDYTKYLRRLKRQARKALKEGVRQ